MVNINNRNNYLFKPSPQIIDVYPHNFIFPPNLLKFEPFDFLDLIPLKFEPTNFNTLLKDSIETKQSISIWKLKFFLWIFIDYWGFGQTFLIKHFLSNLFIQYLIRGLGAPKVWHPLRDLILFKCFAYWNLCFWIYFELVSLKSLIFQT